MMNILITGVSSFVGRALAKQLISEGYEVYGTIRKNSPNKDKLPNGVHIIECNLDNIEMLCDMEGIPQINTCVHLAWASTGINDRNNPEAQKQNIDNTLKLIPVLKKLGCERLVFAGSQAEYGIHNSIISEKSECNPVSEYGKAKLEVLKKASALCKELEMTYIHLRIFSVYGPGDHETTLVSSCVKAFAAGEHISLGRCTQLWNFLYISDCAKAIADLVSCPFITAEDEGDGEYVVNIASEITKPLKEFVEDIHATIGKGSYDFDKDVTRPEGTPQLNPDTSRLKRLTGFKENVSFAKGIENYEKNICSGTVL